MEATDDKEKEELILLSEDRCLGQFFLFNSLELAAQL